MPQPIIQSIPAPSIAFIFNSLAEHSKLSQPIDTNGVDGYMALNTALNYQFEFVPFKQMWEADADRPNHESINALFEKMQDTINILYPTAMAFLLATHYNYDTLTHYADDIQYYFKDCQNSAYQTFKDALFGLDEEMYQRIGSIAEVQKLIFTYCKGFSLSADIQAFHDLSEENDLELALDIVHLSFATLTWALNLSNDFQQAPIEYSN